MSVVESQPVAATEREPMRPLSLGAILWFSIANLGYGAFYALNNATLPLFLEQYTKNAVLLGLMGSTHSIEGAIIQPAVGAVSDSLRTPLGRRRPFLLLFVPLSSLFLILTPVAAHLPGAIRLGGMIGAIFLFTVLFNMAWGPYQAMIPDMTPETQRGRVMGISTLFGVLGQAGLMLLGIPLILKFVLVAGLMLITTLITCATVKEPTLTEQPARKRSHYQEVGEALRGLRTLKQARLSLLALLFSGIGIGAVMPFLTLFVKKITGCSDDQAQQMFLVLMLSTLIFVVPCGWLTDKIGPKRMLIGGLSLIAVASFGALWASSLWQIGIALSLAGIGNAAQSAATYPLLTELVPNEEVGFYTGLQSTALSIAQPVTSVLTGTLINRGGYRTIFVVCAAGVLFAVFTLLRMQLRLAAQEITARDREQGRTGAASC